jgi:uncharacterized repeat protein (TIGR03803 family)
MYNRYVPGESSDAMPRLELEASKGARVNRIGAFVMICTMVSAAMHAQTFTTLVNFDGANGASPSGPLVQGLNGRLYGATAGGDAYQFGGLFVMTPDGELTSLLSFDGSDGQNPEGGLMLTSSGLFYGTTHTGGADGYGTVFQVAPTGTLTTLYSFNNTNGARPLSGLGEAFDGMFYGTTSGEIFRVSPDGTLQVVYICSQMDCTDPYTPIQATNGLLYGAARRGGQSGDGTIYSLSLSGTFSLLHNFSGVDGAKPAGPLVEGVDKNFYGVTAGGGANGYGTVFRITPAGELTTLYSFGGSDGIEPEGGLLLASDLNFYGTTAFGGASGDGTIFEITLQGVLTTLHNFDSTDGDLPTAALAQDTSGTIYGTTRKGGTDGDGTVFSLSCTPLTPFIQTVPWFGKVGAKVAILGTDLTGASSVTFRGAQAQFRVVSPTEILATVPSNATSGDVKVVTPRQILTNTDVFVVF